MVGRLLGWRNVGVLHDCILGTESSGTNAFFVDAGIAAPSLPTVTAAQCWHPMAFWTSRGRTMEERFNSISDLPLMKV